MTMRMLIDAAHPEEVRVVVLNGNRLDEFDFETSTKKQNKGNIYLAKVTRVEPSLQAAFVEYGGDRHGFLAFNEIHPDYYQIPIADREALAAEDAAEASEAEAADAQAAKSDNGESDSADPSVQVVSGSDVDDITRRRTHPSRRYKMQEVIKRRQIMLVQVVKEERGTKGAALTTYISLAGRYCVLMPNSGRGGGISRKIVNPEDRKRLKAIAADLPVPEGIGIILRTAGMERSKAEIKRDFIYLLKLWDEIRERTLTSVAPTMVHEEANLVKRAIRDLYSKDIEEVLVDGDEGYRTAKQVMRTLMPSHAKRVTQYRDRIPLFHRFQVEGQFDAMHSPTVQLKSGGYIVISPTEALVAIDVNSGRATRERNIEETASKTNLEAAEEIARQLRLRDLAGLIVVDFIDMDETKNVRTVERRFKEAMKTDRARIQMGHISTFGLLELSRQRLRPSLLEVSSLMCPHCRGTGRIRSTESAALHLLRAIEEEGIRARSSEISIFVPTPVALYIFNRKRKDLRAIEERYDFHIHIDADDSLIQPDFRLERTKLHAAAEKEADAIETAEADEAKTDRKWRQRRGRHRGEEAAPQKAVEIPDEAAPEAKVEAVETAADTPDGDATEEAPRKRRRRGKRGGRRHRAAAAQADAGADAAVAGSDGPAAASDRETQPAPELSAPVAAAEEHTGGDTVSAGGEETAKPKRTRRTRRKKTESVDAAPVDVDPGEAETAKPKRSRRAPRIRTPRIEADDEAVVQTEPAAAPSVREPMDIAAAPVHREETGRETSPPPHVSTVDTPDEMPGANRPGGGRRRGWWQRLRS